MVDMKNRSAIAIWKDCDPTVADAIERFQDRWEPHSAASKRYPLARLVEELIDPAVLTYTSTLPSHYLGYIPGAGTGVVLSEVMRLVGVDALVRLQRRLLRAFVLTEDQQSERDQIYIATLETLVELVWACKRKQPAEQNIHGLNGRRLKDFCRFCGTLAELASFTQAAEASDAESEQRIEERLRMSELRGIDGELRLSSLYCEIHRPRLADKSWNPAYRKAKRSVEQFDLELLRLSRQCASRGTSQANSGDELVDSYIQNYMLGQTLQLADEAELRNLARLMVDSRFSDRKKQILMLLRLGFNQSEIARRLGIERQAVSKAITSIPEIFFLRRLKTLAK